MPHEDVTFANRREFLATVGGVAAVATASVTALGDEPPAAQKKKQVEFEPIKIPDWVYDVTRMAFLTPGEVERAVKAGAQVIHGNAVWPYFPLRRDGGSLPAAEREVLTKFIEACHSRGAKLVLGLPPFPSVELVKAHPDWQVDPDGSGKSAQVEPKENDLGTRLGCNLGPWGDYLIEICAELVADYGVDGYSFDGNYHAPLCHCPACRDAYRRDAKKDLPAKIDLASVAYREYLVWRGERLEDHYRRMQERLKKQNPDAVLMSWTVNAGRYGHFLHSPRAMPTRLNLLFDLPMQEWWLDETNFGASVAPAFGAAYLRATTGGRPCGSEPYLMSRGNPYGSDSFPEHERNVRTLLATTNGCLAPQSLGFLPRGESFAAAMNEIRRREPWLKRARQMPWAVLLVSEQTRQFYAWQNIAERFLPHVFGAFRAAIEEHLPLNLVNDWDVTEKSLEPYRVLVLANSAALSDAQCEALRSFVKRGGGLVATCESSLCDELGRPRRGFALADLFGVEYQGRPQAPLVRPELDAEFAVAVDEKYWQQRVGVATLDWARHEITSDERLQKLVPTSSVIFRGPQVLVNKPIDGEVVARLRPEGSTAEPTPAIVARRFGEGRVVYLAAGLDAALWSYGYPYQRRLLTRAIEWAAGQSFPISVTAPMCVQTTYWTQADDAGDGTIIHFFNGSNSTAHHGLPAAEVPLREESLPIHGISVRFTKPVPAKVAIRPGNVPVKIRPEKEALVVDLPPLDLHYMLVATT